MLRQSFLFPASPGDGHSSWAARCCNAGRSSFIGPGARYRIAVYPFAATALAAALVCLAADAASGADDAPPPPAAAKQPTASDVPGAPTINIVVPLRDGRFYSPRALVGECNQKLGTKYDLAEVPDREAALSGAERAALLVAQDLGLLKVQLELGQLTLSIPDRSTARAASWLEKLLGRPADTWPANLGLHVPSGFQASRRAVLLIHGLESRAQSLKRMRAAFEHWGVQVVVFDFPNDGPIARSGDHLRDALNQFANQFPNARLVIVAHSMGGLVARYALEMPGAKPASVSDLFLLGTPNRGSRLASTQPYLELVADVLLRLPYPEDIMADGTGEAATDLQPGSRFLTTLNAAGRAKRVRYFVGMGRKSFLSDAVRTGLEREWERHCDARHVADDVRHAVLDVLQAEELRDGHGDGAVTLDNARLPGADRERIFDLNHWQLLACPVDPPEEAAVFHWIIQTLQWERDGEP